MLAATAARAARARMPRLAGRVCLAPATGCTRRNARRAVRTTVCRYSSTTRAPESNLLAALRAAAKPSDRVSPQDLLSRVQHLALPDGCAKGKHDLFEVALVIPGAFTPQECEAFIEAARASEDGWHEAQVNIGGGREKPMKDVRESERCMLDDTGAAEWMWQRVGRCLPEEYSGRKAVGLNERLRILKYGPGGFFKPHYDGSFVRGPEFGAREMERSLLTFFLYLNDGYEGGRTTLLSPHNEHDTLEIEPRTGTLLVTQHDVLHEGACVRSGEKWALRTDVMFAPIRAADWARLQWSRVRGTR